WTFGHGPVYPQSFFGDEKRWTSPISANGVAEYPGDPGHGHQQRYVAVIDAGRFELAVDLGDLRVEIFDYRHGGEHTASPRLGNSRRPSSSLPERPNRSDTGQRCPNARSCP